MKCHFENCKNKGQETASYYGICLKHRKMQEKIEKEKTENYNELKTLNRICFWLVDKCRETNAESMRIVQEKIIHNGKNIGNWEITIKKLNEPKS